MFWFKNAMAYRLTSKIDFSKIEKALQSHEDDLRDNREYCYLGDRCDYQKWKSLREWINTQPSES